MGPPLWNGSPHSNGRATLEQHNMSNSSMFDFRLVVILLSTPSGPHDPHATSHDPPFPRKQVSAWPVDAFSEMHSVRCIQ
eukprot:359653-Chlamydomonas_euryale.AAC.5